MGSSAYPDTVGDLDILIDLKARQTVLSVTLDAPNDKGGRGRIGWLLRQLKDAPSNLAIESYPKNARNGMAAPLSSAIEDPLVLLGPDKKDPAKFTLVARSELGINRRASRKPGFTQSVIAAIESFYGDVLQNLTAHQPNAPQLAPRATPPEIEHSPLPSVDLVEPVAPQVDLRQEAKPVVARPASSQSPVDSSGLPAWFVSRTET